MFNVLERDPSLFHIFWGRTFRFQPPQQTIYELEDLNLDMPDIVHQDSSGKFWLGERVSFLNPPAPGKSLQSYLEDTFDQALSKTGETQKEQSIRVAQKLERLPASIKNHPDLLPFARSFVYDSLNPGYFASNFKFK